ncbi:MAG TPA: DUF6798 domain-containing protein, partial [Polyangiaceae bacterium]|nr:DUF6798 domain-containing protein [Polyangiaceae bacterium]
MSEPESSRRAERTSALGVGLAGVVSLLFAGSLGFNYGVGNQVTYLIPALRRLDPELFLRDWFATQTTQYHPVFSGLAAALLALDRGGWGIALGLTATVALAFFALFLLARDLTGRTLGLGAYLLLATLVFTTQTRGPGFTYVFDRELQPSTLASALLLGAVLAFSRGRFFAASVWLALAGLFHLNFSLLCVLAFALAQLVLGRAELAARLGRQLALPALGLLGFTPMLLAAAAPAAGAALGRHIYLTIRAPHHFALAQKLAEFAPLFAWQWLAAGVALPLALRAGLEPWRRLGAAIAGLLAVVWVGSAAALASERAATLFSWRLAPHAELLLELATIASAVRVLFEPALLRHYGLVARALAASGLVAVIATYAWVGERAQLHASLAIAVLLIAGATEHRAPAFARIGPNGPALFSALAGVFLVNFALGPLARLKGHSNLLAAPDTSTRELTAWMREHSPKQALFLTPPDDGDLRFRGERAIVVDWKGNPAVPTEVLAWYERVSAVVGRPPVNEADLAGYDALDPPRLAALQQRYGFDYAVVRLAEQERFSDYRRAFVNEDYVVLE